MVRRYPAPRPFTRHLKLCKAPQAVGAVDTNLDATTLQEDLDTAITVAGILPRQLMHRFEHWSVFFGKTRLVADRRPRNPK
jgi:hypothetical protein